MDKGGAPAAVTSSSLPQEQQQHQDLHKPEELPRSTRGGGGGGGGAHVALTDPSPSSSSSSNARPNENATLPIHNPIPAATHRRFSGGAGSESSHPRNAGASALVEETMAEADAEEEEDAVVGSKSDAFLTQQQQQQQQQQQHQDEEEEEEEEEAQQQSHCSKGEPSLKSSSATTSKGAWNPKIKTPWRSHWKPNDSGKGSPAPAPAKTSIEKDWGRHSTNLASNKADREKKSSNSPAAPSPQSSSAAAAATAASPAQRTKPRVREPAKPKEEGQASSPQARAPSPPTTAMGNGKLTPSSLIKDGHGSASLPSSPSAKPALRKTTTPSSMSSERILPSHTSPVRTPSRFMGSVMPKSPSSSLVINRGTPECNPSANSPHHHHHQRRASLEGERVHSSVKDFFHRRKSVIGIGIGSRKFGDNEGSIAASDLVTSTTLLAARDNPDLGPFLLKLAKQTVTLGDNPQKALDYATRAAKSFESAAYGKPSLDLVMSLHILAAIHCTLGQFEEAIPVLVRSIQVPDIEFGGQDHALAAFAGNMQLGDTYALLGQGEDALTAYHAALDVQKRALGDHDPRVAETCRYLAEAHTQAMQFDIAEELCQHALDIHKEHSPPASIEEATDRRLMGLICNGKGRFEAALENLVLASMALIANNKDVDVAAVDVSIGDTYVSLGRFDEAVFAYQKALTVFKSSKGENHVLVASVYVSLAEAYLKVGKIRECKTYSESALRIYNSNSNKQGGGGGAGVHLLDEVASGLTDLAVVYESLNEHEQALCLLKKSLSILESVPGQQSAIAGVEAQIGVLSYMCGNYVDAQVSFNKAIVKLRASAEKNSALFGIVLNQMGLCCLHLSEIKRAVEYFEESRSVLEVACGPRHPDSLLVYSNLAAAYDALGRLDDAINALQYVVEVREEELGTAQPGADDERSRLSELLKEAGRLRARRLNNTLALLMQPKSEAAVIGQNATLSVPVNG